MEDIQSVKMFGGSVIFRIVFGSLLSIEGRPYKGLLEKTFVGVFKEVPSIKYPFSLI